MQKALPNSLQIFNKKRTLPRDRHFSQTYTQGRETRFLTSYLVAKLLIFLRNPVFWRGIGCMACRMPNPFFPRTSIRYIRYTPELPLLDIAVLKRGEVCPMPHALRGPVWPMPHAPCPMPHARRVPHVTEKGYN